MYSSSKIFNFSLSLKYCHFTFSSCLVLLSCVVKTFVNTKNFKSKSSAMEMGRFMNNTL